MSKRCGWESWAAIIRGLSVHGTGEALKRINGRGFVFERQRGQTSAVCLP